MREIWGELKNAREEGLLALVPPLPNAVRVLTVDSTRYLRRLRESMPKAEIYALTSFADAVELPSVEGLDIRWQVADFRLHAPTEYYQQEFFDIIIADPCLEFAYEPYDTFLSLNRLLKMTGYVVSQFPNIRYHEVLENLRRGEFPVQERHFFAKTEVVHLLSDAMYQEISFAPLARDEQVSVAPWEEFGFVNDSEDLLTEVWMLRADRSTAAVAALKSLYDKETRKNLARILHRLEYDIDTDNQLAALQELCRREMIFPDYLRDFIHEAVFHEDKVLGLVQELL
ncbi:MAG: methyltransferase [Selenomonadaceae bacterium]|nr:methyltransferase [Selenomonadaceae bacterium]